MKADGFRIAGGGLSYDGLVVSANEPLWFQDQNDAARRGFGVLGAGWPDMPAFVEVHDKAFSAVQDQCEQKAYQKLGGATAIRQQVGDLAHNMFAPVQSLKKDDLQDKVFVCLESVGFKTTKTGPQVNSFYGRDLGISLGASVKPALPIPNNKIRVQIFPAVKVAKYVPTAEEVKMAVAMYDCSVKTGARAEYAKRLYDAKVKAVAANEATLTELKPKIEAMVKAAAALSL